MKKRTSRSRTTTLPLCVDLDGTLVRTDTLLESVLLLTKKNPWQLVAMARWFFKGKAYAKEKIAQRSRLNVVLLPYNQELLTYLRAEHARGRKLYLATASPMKTAAHIMAHLDIFEDVVATHGKKNLKGRYKARALAEKFGRKKFAYAGNSFTDIPVWRAAHEAIVVSRNSRLIRAARKVALVTHVFTGPTLSWQRLIRLLRVYQWTKNLLLFVPLLAAHRAADTALLQEALIAFFAFCSASSAAYIINDLTDLESDRQHPRKKYRPLAHGDISLTTALSLAILLLVSSGIVAWGVSPSFLVLVAAYLCVTLWYSLTLKQLALLDVFTLAGLYCLRIFAGAVAVGVPVSSWLAAFALFLFLSLALVKRFSELTRLAHEKTKKIVGRGYEVSDTRVISQLGTASAYLSALILALYISSNEVSVLYTTPALLWLTVPLFLFWVSRVWFLAQRNQLEDDPLIFAIRDPVSYVVGIAIASVTWWAV